jgi:hypothetical protein
MGKDSVVETKIKEIAAVLRSTEKMAGQFADRVEERLGTPVTHTELLAILNGMPAHTLTMDKVVSKLRRQLRSH